MFNNRNLQNMSTRDVLSGYMNGKYPMRDPFAKDGQNSYYYLQPKKNQYGIEEDEQERIYVPSENSPNPTWTNQNPNSQQGAATFPYTSSSMRWNNSLDASPSSLNSSGTQYASNENTALGTTQQSLSNTNPWKSAITQNFKDRIGDIESGSTGGYQAYTPEGGSMGALGKYQFRKPALQDLGFVNRQGQWSGQQNINNRDDFLSNPQVQEDAADKYFLMNGKQLMANCNAENYLDKTISGVSGQKFPVSAGGLLAASHRMGSRKVCNYMENLDQNPEGDYYMNYNNMTPDKDKIFRAIETRLRKFAW